MTIVTPSWFSSSNSCIRAVLERESSAPVGSSASRSLGLFTIARAIATLCFCPPDSCAGVNDILSCSPTLVRAAFARLIRSRFLNDIPQELIRPLGDRSTSRMSRSSSQRASRWENNPSWSRGVYSAASSGTSTYTHSNEPIRRTGSAISTKPAASQTAANSKAETEFHALDKVRHNSWGEGTVLESKMEGGDEILTIQFKSVGLKKVIAGMTKLVKLNKPLS